jgi:hypothetical protein
VPYFLFLLIGLKRTGGEFYPRSLKIAVLGKTLPRSNPRTGDRTIYADLGVILINNKDFGGFFFEYANMEIQI